MILAMLVAAAVLYLADTHFNDGKFSDGLVRMADSIAHRR